MANSIKKNYPVIIMLLLALLAISFYIIYFQNRMYNIDLKKYQENNYLNPVSVNTKQDISNKKN